MGPVRTPSDGLTRAASKLERMQGSSTQTNSGCNHRHRILKCFDNVYAHDFEVVSRTSAVCGRFFLFFFSKWSVPVKTGNMSFLFPKSLFFCNLTALKTLCTLDYSQIHLVTPVCITIITTAKKVISCYCVLYNSWWQRQTSSQFLCYKYLPLWQHHISTGWNDKSYFLTNVTYLKWCSTLKFAILYSNIHTTP